jgi:acetylornithine deacetylase/succinyl-diaminopimelate desuccinylase-like protein
LAKLETRPIKADLAQIASGSQAAMTKVAAASPAWNSTLRTTCVATRLEGGHADNALPQLAAANVNCRILPEDSPEYVLSTLQKVAADDQVSIKAMGEPAQGPASPLRPDLLNAVTRITDTMWPGVATVPMMVMGATDGRYLRIAGIPTYGIQGFFMDRDDVRFHGRDERLLVQSFYEGQKFLYELVKDLAKPAK